MFIVAREKSSVSVGSAAQFGSKLPEDVWSPGVLRVIR